MSVQRKRYSAELKARVALEASKGQKTANEIEARVRGSPNPDRPVEETSAGWQTLATVTAPVSTCRCGV